MAQWMHVVLLVSYSDLVELRSVYSFPLRSCLKATERHLLYCCLPPKTGEFASFLSQPGWRNGRL